MYRGSPPALNAETLVSFTYVRYWETDKDVSPSLRYASAERESEE